MEDKKNVETNKRPLQLKVERFKELSPVELSDIHGAASLNCNAGGCNTTKAIGCVSNED